MIHETFRLEPWAAEFAWVCVGAQPPPPASQPPPPPDPHPAPPQSHRPIQSARLRREGRIVTGPGDIVAVEALRARAAIPRTAWGQPLATDVFVWNRGEAPDRTMTKIGGLPAWPVRRPWPLAGPGCPMAFVGQIQLGDSLDLLAARGIHPPGDLLLVFAEGPYLGNWTEEDKDSLAVEWVRMDERPWIAPGDLPRTAWTPEPCWGARYRTLDFPGAPPEAWGTADEAQRVGIWEGTKIGGAPRWVFREEPQPGLFLAALGSIQPALDSPWPFLNVEPPMAQPHPARLQWGRCGTLYLFLNDRGYEFWTLQGY